MRLCRAVVLTEKARKTHSASMATRYDSTVNTQERDLQGEQELRNLYQGSIKVRETPPECLGPPLEIQVSTAPDSKLEELSVAMAKVEAEKFQLKEKYNWQI